MDENQLSLQLNEKTLTGLDRINESIRVLIHWKLLENFTLHIEGESDRIE